MTGHSTRRKPGKPFDRSRKFSFIVIQATRLVRAVLLFGACAFVSIEAVVMAADVTGEIERLGNPFAARFSTLNRSFARNVWDMQRHGGRIYLGHGDYGTNVGPITLWALDPVSAAFSSELTVQQEQIEKFSMLEGNLAIPGTDPRDSENVAYYVLEDGQWLKKGIGSSFLHCFDVISSGSTRIAGIGASQNVVMRASPNGGQTWTTAAIVSGEPTAISTSAVRIYTLFKFNGEIYGSGSFAYVMNTALGPRSRAATLARFESPESAQILGLSVSDAMLPGNPTQRTASPFSQMLRPLNYKNQLVYINAESSDVWIPLGLCVSDEIGSARLVTLKDNAVAYDIIEGEDGRLYVLGNIKVGNGQYLVTVNSTTDLVEWTEEFRFSSASFARSFEMLNGCFFFGLGCVGSNPLAASGDILRYAPPAAALPRISLGENSVPENSAPGTVIGTLGAINVDLGALLSFSFATGGDAGGRFEIDGTNLVVAPDAGLDYESSATYQVVIRLSGILGTLVEQPFTISIQDVNERPSLDLNGPGLGVDQAGHTLGSNSLVQLLGDELQYLDPESGAPAWVSVRLDPRPDGPAERLEATTTSELLTIGEYDSSTGLMLIEGSAPVGEFLRVLRSLAYVNTSAQPQIERRTITFIASDGELESAAAICPVAIEMRALLEVHHESETLVNDEVVTLGVIGEAGGLAVERVLTLFNGGDSPLQIESIDVANATVVATPPALIDARSSETLTLSLPLERPGPASAELEIRSTDALHSPFRVTFESEVLPAATLPNAAADEWVNYQ